MMMVLKVISGLQVAKGSCFKGRFTQIPSHFRSIRAISTIDNIEVGSYHFTQGPKS